LLFAVFLSGRVCYFLRISFEIAAEKDHAISTQKIHEKDVQNMWKNHGDSEETRWNRLCKTLWITCG